MRVGVLSDSSDRSSQISETRVAATPDSVKKLKKLGLDVAIESGAGLKAGFSDDLYKAQGAEILSASDIFKSDILLKVHRPNDSEISQIKSKSTLICLSDPYSGAENFFDKLAKQNINAFAMELIPRTTRAQSMDVLSSQANIAGYRAVIEACSHYGRFSSMMMTSAGMAKPAKVLVLGVGVAGLQAIATAKRLGGVVEAFDVRAAVKEQVLSLGAKFLELNLGEEGSGTGGYAKELSEAGKKKQMELLTQEIKRFDWVISTANIPGRKAPVLITEEALKGMRPGSVIVDMAAQNGGNCPLTEANKTVTKYGVTLIGVTNFPALVPTDSSAFYSNNLVNLLSLMVKPKDGKAEFNIDMKDDILEASLVVQAGENSGSIRFGKKVS
ncbi:MAG: Re/Si-specific NAD(P)(+) transhydrogenase subunit alpha [Deltaproteobacteria bacterium]|nr:Re/Si-specific NAD(P)(+) transhydrogenase subunit alpha [Deltaproteobacteria bacterium]